MWSSTQVMAPKQPSTGLFVGLNKGHIVTKKELAPRPSDRKGVSWFCTTNVFIIFRCIIHSVRVRNCVRARRVLFIVLFSGLPKLFHSCLQLWRWWFVVWYSTTRAKLFYHKLSSRFKILFMAQSDGALLYRFCMLVRHLFVLHLVYLDCAPFLMKFMLLF